MPEYNYKIINEHFIVTIDGYDFLLDTGSELSFYFDLPLAININGRVEKNFSLMPKYCVKKMRELIGNNDIAGLIGENIIKKYGLTIIKDTKNKGRIIFGVEEDKNGNIIHFVTGENNVVIGDFNGHRNLRIFFDTGAKYGYFRKELLDGLKPVEEVYDYNPVLGDMDSVFYGQHDIVLDGKSYKINVGYNTDVDKEILPEDKYNYHIVGSCLYMFEKRCIFDYKNRVLVLD